MLDFSAGFELDESDEDEDFVLDPSDEPLDEESEDSFDDVSDVLDELLLDEESRLSLR